MKYCMKCGTALPDDAVFCFKCGAKQNYVVPETPKPEAPEPEPPRVSAPPSPNPPQPPVKPDNQEPKTVKEIVLKICEVLYSEEPHEDNGPYTKHLGDFIDTYFKDNIPIRDFMSYHFNAAVRNGEVQCSFTRQNKDELLAIVSDDHDIVIFDPESPCSYPLPSEPNETYRFGRFVTVPHTVSLIRISLPFNITTHSIVATYEEALQAARDGMYNSGTAFMTELIEKIKLR